MFQVDKRFTHGTIRRKHEGEFWVKLGQEMGFPGSSTGKESACNAGDLGSVPGLGRSPGEGKDYPSRILAWRIPWTEEPGRLQSMW